jgi:hypothetical protein
VSLDSGEICPAKRTALDDPRHGEAKKPQSDTHTQTGVQRCKRSVISFAVAASSPIWQDAPIRELEKREMLTKKWSEWLSRFPALHD